MTMATTEELGGAIATKNMEDVGGGLFRCFSVDGSKQGLCLPSGWNVLPEVFTLIENYGANGTNGWVIHSGDVETGATHVLTKDKLLAGLRNQTTKRLLEEAFSSPK